jgi:predicted GIY-YIG superfamily endonuclease
VRVLDFQARAGRSRQRGEFYYFARRDARTSIENKNAYTHDKRPVGLVWFKTFHNVRDAIPFEKKLKGWSRRKKKL